MTSGSNQKQDYPKFLKFFADPLFRKVSCIGNQGGGMFKENFPRLGNRVKIVDKKKWIGNEGNLY